jgi:hypothetical protein
MGVKDNRCEVCNKRLGLIVHTCKCGKRLCALHKGLSDHLCSFNFKSENIEKMKMNIDLDAKPVKLNKI